MKFLLLFFVVFYSVFLNASFIFNKTNIFSKDYSTSLTPRQKNRNFEKKLINKSKCDRVLRNPVLSSCYNDNLKSSIIVSYVLDSHNVHSINLKKRGKWHYNKSIPKKYRSSNSDYRKTGYDKGHLAMDSGFDFNKKILNYTYDLNINSVPMAAKVNRKTWLKAEKYSKNIAKKLGYINVFDIIIFNKKPKRIGKNQIAVPKGFYKVLFNDDKKFQKCFYYENIKNPNLKNDKLKKHIVKCKKVYNFIQN